MSLLLLFPLLLISLKPAAVARISAIPTAIDISSAILVFLTWRPAVVGILAVADVPSVNGVSIRSGVPVVGVP